MSETNIGTWHGTTILSVRKAGRVVNPSFLAFDPQQRYLYAVNEAEGPVLPAGGDGLLRSDLDVL